MYNSGTAYRVTEVLRDIHCVAYGVRLFVAQATVRSKAPLDGYYISYTLGNTSIF